MLSWFLNPGFFALAVGLISAPIIIHLINRMRFRRVRWAAMEFLLKSQKRNRRRLIIEQLILLALRCLLVALAGLLVLRFTQAMGTGPGAVSHLIIIDDTVSMSDHWKDQGADETSFDVGKQLVKDTVKKLMNANSVQNLRLVRLSECDPLTVAREGRLDDALVNDLNKYLDDKDTQPTALHVSPLVALRTAAKVFEADRESRKIFYFVSDFRDRDWGGPEGEKIAQALDDLTKLGVHVKLVDVAHPSRGESRQALQHHDNLAVTELRPESRVCPVDIPLQFTVTVYNYSTSERKGVRVTVRADGMERNEGSLTLPSVPPGPTTATFQIGFNLEGVRTVTANIEPEDAGLLADNIRYAVVEVRKQVPILVVDGNRLAGQRRPGGTYFLQQLFSAAKGYQIVSKTDEELAKLDLMAFPCVFLLNVKDFKEPAVLNLEKYVREGGGAAFFLGDEVQPGRYNELLYKGGKGLFPAPLQLQPTVEKLDDLEKVMRTLAQQPSLFVRNEQHPLFADVYKEDKDKQINKFFPYITFEKFYGIQRGRWQRTENQDELLTLPNRQALDVYRAEALELAKEVGTLAEKPEWKTYQPALDRHFRDLRDGLGGKYDHLFQLAADLDLTLHDAGKAEDPQRPNLVEFWAMPEHKGLARRLDALRERVQYGDPLALGNRFGKGRVVAFLTAVGSPGDAVGGSVPPAPWNDWPNGPGCSTFVIFMQALQKYLASAGDEASYTVGVPVEFKVDGARYDGRMRRFYQARQPEPGPRGDDLDEVERAKRDGLDSLGEQQRDAGSTKDLLRFTFAEAARPGVYFFHLYPKADAGAKVKPEVRAVAFNIDTDAESDLKRTAREALERSTGDKASLAGTVALHGVDSLPVERESQADLSQAWWFFLIFLVVLVVEQALAVHLSFHLKNNEAQLPAAARPQTSAA